MEATNKFKLQPQVVINVGGGVMGAVGARAPTCTFADEGQAPL